jgi:hypothetical protein
MPFSIKEEELQLLFLIKHYAEYQKEEQGEPKGLKNIT